MDPDNNPNASPMHLVLDDPHDGNNNEEELEFNGGASDLGSLALATPGSPPGGCVSTPMNLRDFPDSLLLERIDFEYECMRACHQSGQKKYFCAFYNVDISQTAQVDIAFRQKVSLIAMILKELQDFRHGLFDDNDVMSKLAYCFEFLGASKHALTYYGQVDRMARCWMRDAAANQEHINQLCPSLCKEEEGLNKYQQLLIFCLHVLSRWKWKKRNGDTVLEEVIVFKVRDADRNIHYVQQHEYEQKASVVVLHKFRTGYWREVCPIDNIVHSKLISRSDREMWSKLTFSAQYARQIEDYLSKCVDPLFPELKVDYRRRSFLNGELELTFDRGCVFRRYDDPSFTRNDNRSSCKMFNQVFDEKTILSCHDFYSIPTRAFQHMLDFQAFDEDTVRVIYALMGRCMHRMENNDDFQVIPFFKGVAGSGKSRVGITLKNMFGHNDVAVLASKAEERFGLEELVDKALWICFEVTKGFTIDRSDLQSMISGEDVSVRQKYKTARTVVWRTPGLLIGNETGGWTDVAGSMSRRLVVINFSVPATSPDSSLQDRINDDIGALICKCHLAYLWMRSEFHDRGFWESVPQNLKDARKRMELLTSPIKAFIRSKYLVRNSDRSTKMTLEDFVNLYREVSSVASSDRSPIDPDQIKTAVLQENIRWEDGARHTCPLTNRMKTTTWLIGVRAATPEDEAEAEETPMRQVPRNQLKFGVLNPEERYRNEERALQEMVFAL